MALTKALGRMIGLGTVDSLNVAAGALVQVAHFQTGAVATGTTLIPSDDTIPQITEGNEFMTLAITPKASTNRLVIMVNFNGASTVTGNMAVALFQDAAANALAVQGLYNPTGNALLDIPLRHEMAAGTTSSTTFRVRAGLNNANTTTFNGASSARLYGGTLASSITIYEIKV